GAGESPAITFPVRLVSTDLADPGSREQQRAVRLEDPFQRGDRCMDIKDIVERLRQNDAVETLAGDLWGMREVSDDRGSGIAWDNVEDVLSKYVGASEPA